MIATLSDELRTPLASVHGAALTVRFRKDELSEARADELLELIADEAARLGDIVEDILLASYLGSGELRPALASCDARELVLAVVERERGRRRDVPINVMASPALPEVLADPELLQQVLASLIDQAVKSSAGRPRIAVRLERRENQLHLSVNDAGADTPPADYSRVDSDHTCAFDGVGLRLYIARELVERMGGRIRILPTPRAGPLFLVELPLAPVRRRARAIRARWFPRRRRRRVPVVATGA